MSNLNELDTSGQIQQSPEKTSFSDFKLLPEVAQSISEMGFSTPTPVQVQCYETVMSGRDAIIMAQTGTGKTAAFGIPMVQKVDTSIVAVQGLVLAPTRELALQVSKEISAIGKGRQIACAAIYGGASFTKQVEEISDGAQIVVGTPGRVLDHIRRGTISFAGLKCLVLDEADEMLSMGFEKELSEIMENMPKTRQSLLFSATIPDDIKRLSGRYLNDEMIISVSGDVVGSTEISHFVYLVSGMGRPVDLIRVIDEERPESAIVFCNTREETQLVANALQEAGHSAMWINSDLSQSEREKVMGSARKGKITFLVATDVAARGIDISHLSHVINYTFPESLEVYIHRTGRTGRQGRHGAAISLIAPQDIGNLYLLRLTYKIFPVEKTLPSKASEQKKAELDRLDQLRKNVNGTVVGDEFLGLAKRLIQHVDVESMLGALLQEHFTIQRKQDSIIKNSQKAHIPTAKSTDDRTAQTKSTSPNGAGGQAAKRRTMPPKKNPVSKQESPNQKKDEPSSRSKAPHTSAEVAQPVEKPSAAPVPETVSGSQGAPSFGIGSGLSKVSKEAAPEESSPSVREAAKNRLDAVFGGLGATREPAPQFESATSERKTDPAPAPEHVSEFPSGDASRPSRGTSVIPSRVSTAAPVRSTTMAPEEGDTDGNVELFIDAGRKDGLRISALMKDIVERTGLPRTDVGKVRMLTRSTFISVPYQNCKAVFNALTQIEIDGQKLGVEYAEES